MFKKFEDVVLGFVFPGSDTIKDNVQFDFIDIQMSPTLLNDFKNSVMIWTLARKLEANLGVRCHYRENQRMLLWNNMDYRGHFVLDVYSDGKNFGPYLIDTHLNGTISITSQRIFAERYEQTDRSITVEFSEAIELISNDFNSKTG